MEIYDIPGSQDVKASFNAVEALGVLVEGGKLRRPREPRITSGYVNLLGSATTLRIFIPVAASIGGRIAVDGDETLRRRPLDPIITALSEKGVRFSSNRLPFIMEGRIRDPEFVIEGWESSQYISGLIYAAIIMGGGRIKIKPPIVSKSFIYLTVEVVKALGSEVKFQGFEIEVSPPSDSREVYRAWVEGDYALSSFYAVSALLTGGGVVIEGLPCVRGYFGDHSITAIYREMGALSFYENGRWIVKASDSYKPVDISIEDAPDLAPSIAALASIASGYTIIRDVRRLRVKESDRISTIISTLKSFNIKSWAGEDLLVIEGSEPSKGYIKCPGDHRIAMLAAALATRAGGIIENPRCVDKSNPGFWDDLKTLGGVIVFEG